MADDKRPLGRAEVEALYKERGSLAGADLKGADLTDIHLVEADLSGADLRRADLTRAHMYGVNLQGANLFKANLEDANLNGADLRGCNLLATVFRNTKLSHVILDPKFVVINEREAREAKLRGDRDTARAKYMEARDVYRSLKVALDKQIPSRDVGMLFVREMVTTRKLMPRFSLRRMLSKFLDLSLGYGEHISRIIASLFIMMIASALLYGIEGVDYRGEIFGFGGEMGLWATIGNLLYFSVVVFTTVGFGDITPIGPLGKATVMVEGIAGTIYLAILIIALFKRSMQR